MQTFCVSSLFVYSTSGGAVKVFNGNNVRITLEIICSDVLWEQLFPSALLRDCISPLVLLPKHERIDAVGAWRTLQPSQPRNKIAPTPLYASSSDCKTDLISFRFRIFSCWRCPALAFGDKKKKTCQILIAMKLSSSKHDSKIWNFQGFKKYIFVNEVLKRTQRLDLEGKKRERKLQLCELNIFSRLLKAFQACNAVPVKPKNKKMCRLADKGKL